MSKEDILEELDERNRLIELKAKRKAVQITQTFTFVFAIIFFIMGKFSGYEGFTAMGVGIALVFTVSMFAEIFAQLYYEGKN